MECVESVEEFCKIVQAVVPGSVVRYEFVRRCSRCIPGVYEMSKKKARLRSMLRSFILPMCCTNCSHKTFYCPFLNERSYRAETVVAKRNRKQIDITLTHNNLTSEERSGAVENLENIQTPEIQTPEERRDGWRQRKKAKVSSAERRPFGPFPKMMADDIRQYLKNQRASELPGIMGVEQYLTYVGSKLSKSTRDYIRDDYQDDSPVQRQVKRCFGCVKIPTNTECLHHFKVARFAEKLSRSEQNIFFQIISDIAGHQTGRKTLVESTILPLSVEDCRRYYDPEKNTSLFSFCPRPVAHHPPDSEHTYSYVSQHENCQDFLLGQKDCLDYVEYLRENADDLPQKDHEVVERMRHMSFNIIPEPLPFHEWYDKFEGASTVKNRSNSYPGTINFFGHRKTENYEKDTGAAEAVPPNVPVPRGKGVELRIYTDSDHTGCLATRRSRTGYFIFISNSPIIWYSKR